MIAAEELHSQQAAGHALRDVLAAALAQAGHPVLHSLEARFWTGACQLWPQAAQVHQTWRPEPWPTCEGRSSLLAAPHSLTRCGWVAASEQHSQTA